MIEQSVCGSGVLVLREIPGCPGKAIDEGSPVTVFTDPLPANTVMVVHGPEIFDSGEVAWLQATVKPSRTIVAGVMARTAAEESHLPVEFCGKPPSEILRMTPGAVFLANRGKTARSGRIFGEIVASRLAERGLVYLECSSRTIFCWNRGDRMLATTLAHQTGYEVADGTATGYPGAVVPEIQKTREIRGCIPGESVYVNGIIIGRATAGTVVVRWNGVQVEAVSGLVPKPHGIEKLSRAGCVDIATAWCKSGSIRMAGAKTAGHAPGTGRVLVIDHCGHEFYARMPDDCCGVLAIGDDTTAVCGHISLHRGIPVLGIVDGDQDLIVPSVFARGSVVVETIAERDDDVGAELSRRVPLHQVQWAAWVEEMLRHLQGRVRIVRDVRDDGDAMHPV